MTLAQLLGVLKTDVTVVIKNLADNELIAELKASCFHSLDDAIEARTVAQWSIDSGSKLVVLLNAAEQVAEQGNAEGGE